MSPRFRVFAAAVVLFLTAVGLWNAHRGRPLPALPAAAMRQEPRLMLWAWETPEDFSTLAPQRAGVAFLAREVLLRDGLTVRPRYQPLRVAPGTWLMAVVRLETGPGFAAGDLQAGRAAHAIAEAARLPNVRAIQVDFDATATEQDFYATVLRRLREELPRDFPISITALVSWCGSHSRLRNLPVEEAVPMFFRMGGPAAARAIAPRNQSVIAEPLCSGAVGVAADETWPALRADQRVYVFHPGPWSRNEIARVNRFGYQGLRGGFSP